jgi:hypothetical protein
LTTEQAAATAGYARLAYVARLAAWGGLLAGALDCLENIGLLVMLSGSISSATVLATSICAGVKFALAIFVLALAGLTFVLV